MIPEVGHFALIIALCIAMAQAVLSLVGAWKGMPNLMAVARPAAQGQFVFVALAFACLGYAFLNNDFSVQYVATNSNSHMPNMYKIAGIWGGHEGSLLLWMLFLSLWMVAVSVFSRNLPPDMVARVLGVMGFVSIGFLSFMLFTSNPFDRLIPAALDGRELNPLLQDPGLIIHPPMLYMGYVGFSVAFSFAIAALLSGRLDSAWARWSRPWTIVAWMFLSVGVALGSWWAYYELGWGGWWFWDPVENASFMPWLVGTALIHSLAVTEKRGGFKNWTVLLAISAFSLSLLGTFLVRSGVLTSVHAFATDPERGVFILAYLTIVIGTSLTLFAWRAPKVGLGGTFNLVSRETFMLAGNIILAVAAGTVLLGTLYPLLLDGLGLGKISVGPPYFNVVFVPLVFFATLLIGIAPYARWKKASLAELAQKLRIPFIAALALAALMPLWAGEWKVLAMLGFFMAFWVIFATGLNVWVRGNTAGKGDVGAGLRTLGRSYYAMVFAHLGVAVCVIGVTMVKNYESEQDMRMDVGETVTIGKYLFRFDGTTQIQGANYSAHRGQFLITRDNKVVTTLFPEKRTYLVQTMPMTEAGIDTGLFRDLYVSLGEPLPGGAWSVRVYYKPFVDWIWAGALFMAFGGFLAISDRRYRLVAKVSGDAAAAPAAPATPPLGAPAAVEAKST